ncbi:MAG: Gfo/Idh/MocA family protein [Hungatella hathewayi]
MQTVRVGIIGGGMISHRHMQIYKNINDRAQLLGFRAEVVAVAEIIPERLKAWGEQYGLDESSLYADYHDMLKRDDIDTIDVCVHNNLHVPVAIEVMKAGFDCYCEKPAAVTYTDAKLMVDAAQKLGRKFHVQISS